MTVLEARNISVSIGKARLLQPVDLSLETGTLTAILGPNGAGKSTFLKALLGLIGHGGETKLDGKTLSSLSPSERAKQIAYLPQGQNHAWPLSVEAVVALGRHPHGGQAHDDQGDNVVERVLEAMGLTALRNQSVLTLSGGEQMRVSLARALAVEASFLLADEPLASLDPRYQFEIMSVLANQAKAGKGIVVVMHDLALAARYADRLVLMKDGALLADGAPHEVLIPERVESAFGVRTHLTEVRRVEGSITAALPDRLD
ncbi:MAG: ABC transporter ATP-binding protein [Hyphomicrobiales bacterium]|jgi:iron complex transport system ATP-binding protein